MPHLLNFVPTYGCRASLDFLMHVEDYGPFRVVYCVMTNLASSQRHDKIGMMTA